MALQKRAKAKIWKVNHYLKRRNSQWKWHQIRIRREISVTISNLLSECTVNTSNSKIEFCHFLNIWEWRMENTMCDTSWKVLWFSFKRKNKYLYLNSGSAQYILASHLLWFIYILLNSVFVHFHHSKDYKKKNPTKTKSLQKMLSDDIANKHVNYWNHIQFRQLWQIQLFKSCPRINYTAEIRHTSLLHTDRSPSQKQTFWITTHCLLILFTWLHFWHFPQDSTH